ncbi:MAG: OmpA family protein, partial [Pseudomonadota bacterium]
PDIQTREAILEAAKKADRSAEMDDQLSLAAGAPEGFDEFSDFSLSLLKDMAEGEITLTDGNLEVSGIAETSGSYEDLLQELSGEIPGNGKVVGNGIIAPVADPYEWKVEYDGEEAILGGFATSRQEIEKLDSALKSVLPDAKVFNRMRIASGEPEGFSGLVDYMIGFFPDLENGGISLSGNNISMSGAAKSGIDQEAFRQKLENLPGGFALAENTVQLPEVPEEPKEEASSAEIKSTAIIGGTAQETEGQAAATDTQGSEETANASQSGDDGSQVAESGAGEAVSAENTQADLPVANPYRWSVSKIPAGVTILGNAASREAADAVVDMVKNTLGVGEVSDRQIPASGAPENFDIVREFVTRQVKLLEAGQGNVIGNQVSVTGRAKNENLRNLINRSVTTRLPDGYAGTTNIVFPKSKIITATPVEILPPVAKPYRWSVSKLADGVVVAGNVASEEKGEEVISLVKAALGVPEVSDQQTVAGGKPAGFDAARALVASQVKLLESGEGSVIDKAVKITGRIKNQNLVNLITRTIDTKLPQGFTGEVNISVPESTVVKAKDVEFISEEAKACQENIVNAINGREIRFETNRAIIKPESEGVLKDVTDVALNCPEVRIEIGGHTDSRGRDAYNQELSEGRAKAVVHYLEQAGVASGRLEAKGYGETLPVADNDTSEGRSQNRRIEFKVIQ